MMKRQPVMPEQAGGVVVCEICPKMARLEDIRQWCQNKTDLNMVAINSSRANFCVAAARSARQNHCKRPYNGFVLVQNEIKFAKLCFS